MRQFFCCHLVLEQVIKLITRGDSSSIKCIASSRVWSPCLKRKKHSPSPPSFFHLVHLDYFGPPSSWTTFSIWAVSQSMSTLNWTACRFNHVFVSNKNTRLKKEKRSSTGKKSGKSRDTKHERAIFWWSSLVPVCKNTPFPLAHTPTLALSNYLPHCAYLSLKCHPPRIREQYVVYLPLI